MNIRNFLMSKEEKILLNKKKDDITKKQLLQKEFTDHMAKLVSSEVIDLLDYTHIMNFYKSGGVIVEMGRYNQILEKIKSLMPCV